MGDTLAKNGDLASDAEARSPSSKLIVLQPGQMFATLLRWPCMGIKLHVLLGNKLGYVHCQMLPSMRKDRMYDVQLCSSSSLDANTPADVHAAYCVCVCVCVQLG